SLYSELEALFADLKLGRRFDGDLGHAHPQAILRLGVFGVPAPARATAIEPYVPRLAERVVRPADRASRIGSDPVFILDQEHPVADFRSEQLGDRRRPE